MMIRTEISKNRTFLMGLAMIGIIIFHHGWIVVPGITAFFYRFGLWGVDIFLFLSGFGCAYALNKYTINTFLLKRLYRIAPTCILAGFIIYFFDLYFHAERTATYLPLRLLSLHRWYIQAIGICYILCPIAFVVIKKFRVSGLFLLIAVAAGLEIITPEMDVFRLSWILGRIPVFLIGIYLGLFDLQVKRWQILISIICLIIAIYLRCTKKTFIFGWAFYLAFAIPFICLVLCKFRIFLQNCHIYHIIEIFGLYSLEIYLIHEYFYWALYPLSVPLWSKYVLFLTIVSLLCLILKKSTDYIQKRIS